MREILFRGKRKDNNEWVYGDLQHDYDNIPKTISNYCGANPIIPETVGQYTGLKDENGKQIFEGDIVQYERFTYAVTDIEPIKNIYAVYMYERNDLGEWIPIQMSEEERTKRDCVVIGNIHDNAELLEVKK